MRVRWTSWMLLLLLPLVALEGAAGAGRVLEPLPHYAEVARQFVRLLPAAHLLQQPLNDAISARAWTNYVASLDYDRAYFLQSDIDAFAAQRETLDDSLKAGDLQFAFDVFNVYRQRLAERQACVTNLLATGFDFSVPENYVWRRKDAPWPADRAAQDELWRLRVKNEYLAYVISRDEFGVTNVPAGSVPTNGIAYASVTNRPAVAAATNGLAAVRAPPPPTPAEFVAKRYRQFQIVIDDSDADWVLQRYLGAVAAAYDPHSTYMAPAAVEDFNIDMNLTLCGIGALLTPEDGTAKIQEVIPGGPAARDTREIRLRPGDKIIGVGQGDQAIEDVLHLPLSQTVRKIRGAKGTTVVLNVISVSDPSGLSVRLVDLVRDDVRLEEQAATSRVERVTLTNGAVRALGVVRLPAFYGSVNQRPGEPGFRSSALDVAHCLAELNTGGVEGLLLDLRNNGGGSLREAIMLAGLFIRTGPVVQVREIGQIQVLPDRDPAVAYRRPVVVLVNRISASASEIVAGALQDYGRAVIVGDSSTHGKGSVQTILQLGSAKNLGSIKVTAASYYRVSGASTQLRGVVPDIILPSVLDYLELGEDKLPNAMPWSRVPAVEYQANTGLAAYVPTLARASALRRAANPAFTRYLRLVDHAQAVQSRTEVPLQIELRRQLARAEHEVRRAEEAVEEGAEGGPPSPADDVMLDEALHILSDLVDLQGKQDLFPPVRDSDTRMRDLVRRIFEP